MIASVKRPKSETLAPAWHAAFLAMLPAIRRQAQITFRKVPLELRHDLIQEVIANCFTAYSRLVELGQEDVAFPSALARFAVAQIRVGRRVGNRLRVRDVMSEYAQHRKKFQVEPLHYFDEEENCWQEIVVEDKRATPAEIAACRIDFSSWLRRLPRRRRKIALALAGGETTTEVAKTFGVTAARISQLRQWLKESWEAFQGEARAKEELRLAVA
jgi:RNA polymerase sigma factor (sigma-70 family)